MNKDDKTELIRLFSKLSTQIHRLSLPEAQALLDVDLRMSRDTLDAQDLKRLREIAKAHK